MNTLEENSPIHDWSGHGPRRAQWPAHVMIDDETLRDGLQSPSVADPPVETKLRIRHLVENLGIDTADAGLPGAGARQREAVLLLCREIARDRMLHQGQLRCPNLACRYPANRRKRSAHRRSH